MAWAVFHKTFNYDFRPDLAVCREFTASDKPVEVTRHLLAAAVKAGAAKAVRAPKKKPDKDSTE